MKVKAFYKRPDDFEYGAIRISCGSANGEAYIVYRGDIDSVKKTIETIYKFLQKQTKEAGLDPRDQ